jgi:hypothetical protein
MEPIANLLSLGMVVDSDDQGNNDGKKHDRTEFVL